MLSLNNLKSAPGARKTSKRVGRGTGSGLGKTSGYGQNGSKSRSGDRKKLYFEGGQLPLTRRIPKRGFKNIFKVKYQIVNVGDIEKADFETKEIDITSLYEKGLVHTVNEPVKVLGKGEVKNSFIVKADAFSIVAKEKIEQAKGKAEVSNSA